MIDEKPLHLWDRLDEVLEHLRQRDLVLLLDFDGTLAPIVERPDAAEMSRGSRAALETLIGRGCRVAVISGRALADVRARAGLTGIAYAGNHGLEIEGSGISRRHPRAQAARARLEAVEADLSARLGSIEGAWVEDKGLTLSIHYRQTPADRWLDLERVVRDAAGARGLRLRGGKRVWEVRPEVEWDKGRAVEFLLETWGRESDWPVYLGDDETDEDAFRVLAERHGLGVLVAAEPTARTRANAYLKDPSEVEAFLQRLAAEMSAS